MKKYFNGDLLKIGIGFFLFIISKCMPDNFSLLLIIIGYIIISYEMYMKAINSLKNKEFFDENSLMILATLGAFYIGSYEEAMMVMLLFEIGEYLGDLAVEKSKRSISSLIDLRSDTVNLLIDGKIKKTSIQDAKKGDVFQVLPGEKIPLDGIIVEGKSFLDTSSLTGEVILKNVKENDKVLSGSINKESVITVKSTSTYQTTTTSRILDLIEKTEDRKSNTEKFITKFAKIYTPIIVGIAFLLVVIPTMLGADFSTWLYRGLVFLVTSCPCALVISVPLGYFCGIGISSKYGAIIKGSNQLDALCNIDYLLLDKTGTITEGVFQVVEINSKILSKKELLNIVASAEEYSTHPIAIAIKNKNKKELKKVSDYKEIEGMGIKCKIEKKEVLIGNKKLFHEHNIKCNNYKENFTTIHIAIDNEYAGFIVISDKVKEFHKDFNKISSVINKDIIILSGDNKTSVKQVAESIGVSSYYGELLPQDKVSKILEYQKLGSTMFIGDGMNDAPAMKIADVGVSIGNIGSDAAIEASDIVLMNENINTLEKIVKISRVTKRRVKIGIIFALFIKFLILFLSIFGMTSIWLAVFADVGVTIISIINVLTIMIKKY